MQSCIRSALTIDSIRLPIRTKETKVETKPGNGVGCVVASGAEYRGKQGMNYVPAISAELVGSTGLWFGSLTVPPGGRTAAHFHEHHETGIYIISGDEVEMYSGERLEVKEITLPGDFIYIPAGLPHVAVNRSQTPANVVLARTDPNEQESVVLCPELDTLVP
jgi:uncharacterized RmlC-like cupin family protein